MSNTALKTAIQGGKVPEKQTKGALAEAVRKIASLTRKADGTKVALAETGGAVLHTAETQGSLFLASMAEGYLGDDRMKVGAVDVRAPVAFLGIGWGLYEVMTGKGGGAHALALGNGVMGSWLASVAVHAGRTLKEKKEGGGTPATASAAPGATPPPVQLQGLSREVMLTPEPLVVEGRRPVRAGRRPARPHRPNRFTRSRREDASELDE
jgi:hypothetical protein